ncbi:uncharacterized protein [Bemisia tabaci]|uniref:uncharacterized protein isoform X2 n=1 Tax=Bemisia tabaci TaxID=7038 RepID=UPI0008F9C083|nr:PREDICTED: orcokinin peptides-like isoform X2 [Bemisia tabaci]
MQSPLAQPRIWILVLQFVVLFAPSHLYPVEDQESEAVYRSSNGPRVPHLGDALLRDLDLLRNRASYYAAQSRQYGPLVSRWEKRFDSLDGSTLGEQKRNFDEIDRSGFNKFTHKRNFDEIDRSGFDSFVKRQRNFDEIDRAGFVGFNKRSVPDAAYQKPPSKAAN